MTPLVLGELRSPSKIFPMLLSVPSPSPSPSPAPSPVFLGLTESWWQELFSGTLGALVGATVAAIAIIVTIRTQRQLFAIERSEVYTATLLADRKRKAELELQLRAQREDVMRQLAVQAAEASKEREIAAMADLVAGADQMRKKFVRGLPVIEDTLFDLQAAGQRWSLEIQDKALSREIQEWPEFIGFLAIHAFTLQDSFVEKIKKDLDANKESLVDVAAGGLGLFLAPETSMEEMLEQRSKAVAFMGEDVYRGIRALAKASSMLKRFTRIRSLSLPEQIHPEGMPSLAELMAESRKSIRASLA